MTTETERHLAYAEAQANHPDPQLQSLLALIYGPSLQPLREAVAREAINAKGPCAGRPGKSHASPSAIPISLK